MINSLFWNIRGIRGKTSFRRLKKILRIHKISFLALCEPMVSDDNLEEIRLKLGFDNAISNPNSKLWAFWNYAGQVEVIHKGDQILHIKFKGAVDFLISCVYAKCSRLLRASLWEAMMDASKLNIPWLIGGDFNVIRSIEEYCGSSQPNRGAMEDFNSIISDCGLLDYAIIKGDYTWAGWRNQTYVQEKLDRLLCNKEWLQVAGDSKTQAFSRVGSDHKPLIYEVISFPRGPSVFRFQNMWIRHGDFRQVVKDSWNMVRAPSGMINFMCRLKNLKQILKIWNKAHFGNIHQLVLDQEKDVQNKEEAFDKDQSTINKNLWEEAVQKYSLYLDQQEDFWRQKSQFKWFSDGDRNTSFFHASAKLRQKQMSITKIQDSAKHWCIDKEAIAKAGIDYYTDLFRADDGVNSCHMVTFLDFIPHVLNADHNQRLLQPVLKAEVHQAVFALDPLSAAGIDGFPGTFFRHCWDIIGDDLVLAVQDFFSGTPLPKSVGSTLITLIPKKDAPVSFSDFRPISLSTFVNKVFTKIIGNRLQEVLPLIISEEQSAFLQGKDITDNILMVQEMSQFIHKKVRGHNMIFKFDVMKAFDRVSWDFLLQMLLKIGFDQKFVDLIMNILHGSWFSLLINGSPAGFFQSSRGVKQGDPISPYLFIMVTEALSRGLKTLLKEGIDTYATPRGFPLVTHSLFADDLIVFINGKQRTIQKLMDFLHGYEAATGQRINRGKSSFIIGKFATKQAIQKIIQITDMVHTTLPFTYLGCPIFCGRAKATYFTGVIQKFAQKLQGWCSKMLSPGGRLILIKHVLASIPIHLMAAMQLPTSVIAKMEKIMSHFLWNDSDQHKRKIWKAWKEVCFPVEENGLGVRNFKHIQASFACKLWWKLRTAKGLWASKIMEGSYPLYKLYTWRMLGPTQQCMDDNAIFLTGKVKGWIWSPDTAGNFSISSAYGILRNKRQRRYDIGEIWKPYIPLKISLFLWRLYNKLLPFPIQLSKMGIHGPFKCPFCNSEDTYIHNFWKCSYAQHIWCHFQQLLQFKAKDGNWRMFMESWLLNPFKGLLHITLQVTFYLILWEIWKCRTAALYGDGFPDANFAIKAITKNLHFACSKMNNKYSRVDDQILKDLGFIPHSLSGVRKQIHLVTWQLPNDGELKINCDGSSFGNPGPAGGGYIIRNSSGKVLAAGYEAYGNKTNMEAEVRAMLVGILVGIQLPHSQIWVESDSQSLVHMLSHNTSSPWALMDYIQDLKTLIHSHAFKLTHIFREGIFAADFLANTASSTQESRQLDCNVLPGTLGLLVLRDNLQLPAIRVK